MSPPPHTHTHTHTKKKKWKRKIHGGMFWDGYGMNVTVLVPVTYTSVTVVTSWLLLCTGDSILHFHTVFTEYLGNQTWSKTFNCAFDSTTKANKQKYSAFTGVLIPYVPEKDRVYCITPRNYLCPLHSTDNRDLQSCQDGPSLPKSL